MRTVILSLMIFLPSSIFGQGAIGTWEDHLPYHSMKQVIAGENDVFGVTDHAIAIYNLRYNEIRKLSTVHGLNEYGISTLAYSNDYGTLVIGYSSTNIDLYRNNVITNISDIRDKYIPGSKEINRIVTKEKYAYILCSFGIVVLDLEKNEIYDTWNPSPNSSTADVLDVAFLGNTIFASTDKGVLSADINNPGLAYFGNWSPVPGIDQNGIYDNIEVADDKLFISRQATGAEGDSLLLLSQGMVSVLSALADQKVFSIVSSENSVLVSRGIGIDEYNTDGLLLREIRNFGWTDPDCRDAIIKDGTVYIADLIRGIVIENNSNSYESVVIPGPLSINSASIYSEEGNIYIAGGQVTEEWENALNPFQAYTFMDRLWTIYSDNDSRDVLRVKPFPHNSSKLYASTWGSGLYVMDETGITEHYDDSNSPLESVVPGSDFVRVCGMAFDDNNMLWLTQSGVDNNIKILKPDNTWVVLPYTIDAPLASDILITRSGKKWIILPGGNGLFILDDNHSPENFGDDEWMKLDVRDQFGKKFNTIYSIAEDLDGNIWIGTNEGPALYYNPERVLSEDIYCHRIKIPRNDGSGLADYLLGTESIKSISIDGGNRKWLGTNSSGVFLVSEDGKELIKSYSTANSPLLSDTIISIDINDVSGEVWIATSKGIISVREKATEGDDSLKKVYAFPNPVRPDYKGLLTITGLARNTNVKITDISGNLVFETTSTGGQTTWDLNNYKGQRSSTGVYLVFCSTENGESSEVIKILIVR